MDDDFAFPVTLDVLGRLKTNGIPTDDEIHAINEALAAPLAKLKSFEEEVKKLDLLRQDIRRQQDVLSDKIKPYQVFLSANKPQLSNEHQSPTASLDAYMSKPRRWRDIALSTPRLWASIHIPIPSPQFSNSQRARDVMEYDIPTRRLIEARAEGARLWLRRSGACALSISLQFIFSAIAEFSLRWRRVEFSLPPRDMAEVLSAVQDVPVLESLVIDEYWNLFHSVGEHSAHWKESSLLKGPNIRNITFRKTPPNISAFPLAWPRIKSLCLANPHPEFDVHKLVTILTLRVQLARCNIELVFSRADFEQLLRYCPQITSLCIRCQDPGIPAWGPQENNGYHVDDNFLKLFLSPDEDGQYLCPRLEEFHCVFRAGFTDAGMLDFIIRRQDGLIPQVAKLKYMRVYFNRPLVMATGVQTQRFVEEGLALEVRYYRPEVFHGPPTPFDGLPLPEAPYSTTERLWE
ncbi:hypothetical protein NLJ89_g9545 [Agrocybe chaxingu]|uniref:F-box domain-containing protein n=1 Tax=Agrocybe chaxingu TaxID=84603 RepID=A0A9W8JT31_9AGAR|nr:hypothetical protein NLJ89_g9545 [Agrocybe chaxingu]